MITIDLNGERREIQDGSTVTELLNSIGADRQRVAVVVNEIIVRPENRDHHFLHENDHVDVLVFAGGG
jgi:sulfur carrier protein